MGLKPLEYSECLLDSPFFRDSIHDHELDLDQADQAIKSLIKECQNLIKALENLSKAQVSFSDMLEKFRLKYVGETETDDYYEYEDAFPLFSQMINKVEEERKRMLEHADIQLVKSLKNFRKEQIGQAKEEKRKFDKESDAVCKLLENHLTLKTSKKKDSSADTQMETELKKFRDLSLDYVTKLQEVNEKKKFELVEILLAYMYGQATFYHMGHEVFEDQKNQLTDLRYKLQTTRERYEVTQNEAEELKEKVRRKFDNGEIQKGMYARQGYLFVHDRSKKNLFGQWVKHYCMYTKENKILSMIPYTQSNVKRSSNTDTLLVASCVRRPTEPSERSFLFDITGQDQRTLTMQCTSEEDRKRWLEAMEGKEPIYMESNEFKMNEGSTTLDETGIQFVLKCMEGVEKRGLTDQGIYRIAGVSSKFNKLLNTGTDPKRIEKLDLISRDSPWEVKTITSAMKQYFRNLSEPIFTFKLHHEFLNSVKLETKEKTVVKLKELVEQLPKDRKEILNRLMYHLKLVASEGKKNLMQESNLGVVLGPTLMKPKEETMAAIMGIKFQSLVIETIIREYDQIFPNGPPKSLLPVNDANGTTYSPKPMVPPQTPPMATGEPSVPRSPSSKYRAPEPPLAKPSPALRSQSDSQTKPVVAERPKNMSGEGPILKKQLSSPVNSITNRPKYPPPGRPQTGGSLKRRPPVANNGRPDTARAGGPASQLWYTETVSPFTSPPEEVKEISNRRESYSMAMDKAIKTIDENSTTELRSPPPVSQKPKLDGPPPITQRPLRPPAQQPPQLAKRKEWTVRAIHDCEAENKAELSFNKGAIITNVKSSTEEGWLIGTLNGKTGLIPENYCEKIE